MSPLAFLSILSALLVISVLGLVWYMKRIRRADHRLQRRSQFTRYGQLAEVSLIVIWAVWVGRAYLDPNPHTWPIGDEYGLSIQSHFVWETLGRCGACVMWNGGLNGGSPAFVELQGSVLHPLVVAGTLAFGAINGSKLALIASLIMAGLAQWWLAHVLGLGRVARLWSAALAIVAGHLAGRMEHGVVNVVLSTAACSLVMPPLLKLTLTGERRATLQLAIVSALALLAGQGYMQIGVALSYLPATLILLVRNVRRPAKLWNEFALAGLLAALLTAVLIVPVLHFWPNFDKLADPNLTSAQTLEYVPLNWVVRDMTFYQNESLDKLPVAYFYMSYVGWVPLLLALVAWRLVPRGARRLMIFLILACGLSLLAASAVSLRLLQPVMPDFIAGLRYPVFIAGLAVPPLLALAAWGLDFLTRQRWPILGFHFSGAQSARPKQVVLKWFLLAVPVLWSIGAAYEQSQPWLRTEKVGIGKQPMIDVMKSATAEWVGFPFAESFWLPLALESNLKVSPTYLPWGWRGREVPAAQFEATRDAAVSTTAEFITEIDSVYLRRRPAPAYAAIDTGSQLIPCRAHALGGDIDVDCESDTGGTLIVREHNWSGWIATQDAAPLALNDAPWLSIAAPAGRHHFEFRYRPWDVPLGLMLSLGGLAITIGLWIRTRPGPARSGPVWSML